MNTCNPQRSHTLYLVSCLIRCALLLLLTFSLPAAPLSAQIDRAETRATAERLLNEGVQLRDEGSKESLQQALQKFAEAQPLFHSLNDDSREALTFLGIGFCYTLLGEQQKAINHVSQALTLFRATGDRDNEAATLGVMGNVYSAAGEPQRALEYLNQALTLFLRYRSSRQRGRGAEQYRQGLR